MVGVSRFVLVLEYFHPWPNSTGFLLARERGWYAEAGIELEIRVPDFGIGDGLDYLAQDLADLAVVPSNRLLVRAERGDRVAGIAAVNQRGLETLRTRADSGIERPRDLEGRRVAYNPTPRGRAIVQDLVARDGGDPSRVVTVDAGPRELDPANGFDGIADATFGSYWAWDVLLTALPAAQERVWLVDDALGLRYHSYLLAARRELLDAQREAVTAFLAVTRRGFLAAIAEPGAALASIERTVPYFPRHVLAASLERIAPTWTHDGEWGRIREELVGPYADWLADHGIIAHPERWSAAIESGLLVPGGVA